MTAYQEFGAVIERLLDRRGLAAGDRELRDVIEGAAPGEALLRRLAPKLGLHAADLFAAAWIDVPQDLTQVDFRAERRLPSLVVRAMHLAPELVREMRERVSLLPQAERVRSGLPPVPPEPVERSRGGVLLRLFANRNLAQSAAYAITTMTGRPVAPSSLLVDMTNGKPPSPEELADYVAVLDISAADVSVMTGFDLPDPMPRRPPVAAEVARLIWAVRRLSYEQVWHTCEMAEAIGQGMR